MSNNLKTDLQVVIFTGVAVVLLIFAVLFGVIWFALQ